MVKLQSSTKTAEVEISSLERAKELKDLFSKYGIKLDIAEENTTINQQELTLSKCFIPPTVYFQD